ncbi:hypothetical protein BH10PLA2_BH10PLA2_22260 [soil metagenome]
MRGARLVAEGPVDLVTNALFSLALLMTVTSRENIWPRLHLVA